MKNIYAKIIEEIAAIEKLDSSAISKVYESIKSNVDSLSEKEAKEVLVTWMFEKFLSAYAVPIMNFEEQVAELKKTME